MDESYASEIIDAIEDALSDYDCEVEYYSPTSDGECGFFEVDINDEYDQDDVDAALEGVLSEYQLDIDDDSDGDFDLNAYWDR